MDLNPVSLALPATGHWGLAYGAADHGAILVDHKSVARIANTKEE
jgi:hypothetical protein